jgi:AraC family transcriptional regulator
LDYQLFLPLATAAAANTRNAQLQGLNMRGDTSKVGGQRLGKVVDHIEKHLNETLTLDKLSEIACLSPYHFHRVFKAEMGESVHEHIKRLRLESAAFKLKYSASSIDKISSDAGYGQNTSFTKAFKQHFGKSPRHYRSEQQQTIDAVINKSVIDIVNLADFDVAYVRVKGNYYDAARNAWQTLMPRAYRSGLIDDDTKAYGITYDSPEITQESQIRYDACIGLASQQGLPGEFRIQTIQGGQYAVFRHVGAYEYLETVYNVIYKYWLPNSGKALRHLPSFCHYHHLDSSRVAEEELITDIYIPVE